MTKTVVIAERLNESGIAAQMYNAFHTIGMEKEVKAARAVFIKPNLTYPTYKMGVTTRVEFVEAIVSALRQINTTTKIYIGEGEGGYNSFSMTEAMRGMGFYDLEKKYPNVQVVNLSDLPTRSIEVKANGKPYIVKLPELFFDEIDFSISCPLPKVHCMTKITLSFKNQWGCLPDIMRLKNHYVFDEIISQVCNVLKFRYAFLDGKYGLDVNGPMNGVPVELDWFVASNSLGAFDMVVSRMMDFDWKKVYHLKKASEYGFMPEIKDVEIIGDIDGLRRKFTLKRDIWNYPALVAFRSERLTHLFYLSRWSKLLHDIMYSVRKRPIE